MSNGNNEYCSDVGSVLLSFGICAFIALIVVICKLCKKYSKETRLIWIVIFGIFASEVTLGSYWLFLVCICYAGTKRNVVTCENVIIKRRGDRFEYN